MLFVEFDEDEDDVLLEGSLDPVDVPLAVFCINWLMIRFEFKNWLKDDEIFLAELAEFCCKGEAISNGGSRSRDR